MAANNKILTSKSSNCSKTNCHMDFPKIDRKTEKKTSINWN